MQIHISQRANRKIEYRECYQREKLKMDGQMVHAVKRRRTSEVMSWVNGGKGKIMEELARWHEG